MNQGFSLKVLLTFLSAIFCAPLAFADEVQNFSPAQKANIENIVHDYLIKNPEVLIEATKSLRKQEEAQMQKQARQAIIVNAPALFNSSVSPVVGNTQGDVTLVEFYDYECGHCRAIAPVVNALLERDKQLRVVYKGLPIFGADSTIAVKAALAAQKQGKFKAFHDALMSAKGNLDQDTVFQFAKNAGLDTLQLQKDMQDPGLETRLKENYKLATALGLVGTPAFVIASNINSANPKDINAIYMPGGTSQEKFEKIINMLRSESH